MKVISHMDGWLYVGMAMCAQAEIELSTTDASQVFSSAQLFWLRAVFAILGAGLSAGKMYRSTSFSDGKKSPDNLPTPQKQPMQDIGLAENPKP